MSSLEGLGVGDPRACEDEAVGFSQDIRIAWIELGLRLFNSGRRAPFRCGIL